MKTYKEVIDETVEHYKTAPFGFNGSNCVYLTEDGKMCALGRCLNNPELLGSMAVNANVVIDENLGGGLKDEYKHLNNAHFWHTLQHYHDCLATNYIEMAEIELQLLYEKDWGNPH